MPVQGKPADPVIILQHLVQAPSVTPEARRALAVVEAWLAPAGFAVERPSFSAPGTPDVENLFAAVGSGRRHLCFAGHVDVVPPGPDESWRHPPFAAEVEDGWLYGRGAVDMKGGLAAMMAGALRFLARRGADFGGRLSFLVTGDEEGPAVNGTARLLDWAVARGERLSAAIVGEPTSAVRLGDQIKVGRRGSLSVTLRVDGRQGHAAYPHLADNPHRALVQLLHGLLSTPLDGGTEHFEPSTLEIVSIDTGNPAWNVIPASASARLNSRFNDGWSRAALLAELEARLRAAAGAEPSPTGARLPIRWGIVPEPSNSEVFLTRDEVLVGTLSSAIEEVTGSRPALSTGGGTSDARFIKTVCPVVDFGPVGATMHAVDERISLADLESAARIYESFLDRYFAA